MYTTLNKIREHRPRTDLWETLLKYLGKTKPDDEPLPLLTILDSNGFDDTLWCFCAVEGFEKEKQLLAITYAREVQDLMLAESKKCFDVFERYANGLATEWEFETARGAAVDAARAARAAAARAAAWADAAAAWTAADVAAAATARAAAARAAAPSHTHSTIKAKQETQLRQLLEKTCTNVTTENSKH